MNFRPAASATAPQIRGLSALGSALLFWSVECSHKKIGKGILAEILSLPKETFFYF